ncbi:hypothetical protein F5887DRAFT_987984 [Amanita rubescens]|nr:hypothetical protein F5887DRAFT_987984 [Amanita rubescens]
MPNNASTDSIEVRTRRNWWHKAKDFIIRNCWMYDMGDNAKLRISDYRIKANIVFIGNHPDHSIPSTSHADQGEAQETDQPESPLPDISMPQDGIPSRDEDNQPQTLVQAKSNFSVSPPDPNNAFESDAEAISDCANPDVPSSSSEAYASTTRGQSHIYSLEMLFLEAGYPLYMPTPSRGLPAAYLRRGVRIGDVGLVTANGAFDFLFSVCQHDDPSDPGVNPSILPDSFEFIKPIIRVNGKFDPGVCLTSHHVNVIHDHSSSSAFQCSAKGAVLALPTGATVYEAMNVRHFQAHAAHHAARWYKYALNEGGRDVSNGSLYLVTECTKSMNWGISVFYANPTANSDHHLTFDKGLCRWEPKRGKVDARVGPKPTDIILSDNDEPNQCVFLRGIKIMLRPDIWDELNGAIDVRCQDGESSNPPFTRTITRSSSHQVSGGQTGSFHQNSSGDHNPSGPSHNVGLNMDWPFQTQAPQAIPTNVVDPSCELHKQEPWLEKVILEDVFRATAPLHPSDPINVMLLHLKPEASVALVHDSVWCDQLPPDFMEDPLNPKIDRLLENVKRSYKAMIGEYESVVLINKELDPKSQHDFDASHPIIGSFLFLFRFQK